MASAPIPLPPFFCHRNYPARITPQSSASWVAIQTPPTARPTEASGLRMFRTISICDCPSDTCTFWAASKVVATNEAKFTLRP